MLVEVDPPWPSVSTTGQQCPCLQSTLDCLTVYYYTALFVGTGLFWLSINTRQLRTYGVRLTLSTILRTIALFGSTARAEPTRPGAATRTRDPRPIKRQHARLPLTCTYLEASCAGGSFCTSIVDDLACGWCDCGGCGISQPANNLYLHSHWQFQFSNFKSRFYRPPSKLLKNNCHFIGPDVDWSTLTPISSSKLSVMSFESQFEKFDYGSNTHQKPYSRSTIHQH